MRTATTTTAAFALGAASLAVAQNATSPISSIAQTAFGLLTPQCQSTVLQLTSNQALSQCLDFSGALQVISTNDSVLPPLDSWITDLCQVDPCSNETLTNVTSSLIAGCSSDLTNFGLSNDSISELVGFYPLAREVLCLKTVQPYSAPNATIPSNYTGYNSTNGTFCVTSELTKFSTYLGANFTVGYLTTLALGGNASALMSIDALPTISPTTFCSDCIFSAVDLIEQGYPKFGNIVLNSTANVTLDQYLDGSCSIYGYNTTTNGTLPLTIDEVAFNSTYAYNVTTANQTFTPPPYAVSETPLNGTAVTAVESAISTASEAVATTASVNATAMRARWMGQRGN
ncbi:hypothetical protein BCR39DRAFT_512413 [Naematelia encephala]|uniref:Uncharacterized protein n=1 Tax=Naematelia encephala TaxID=71784 RepID=A0A1Y2BM21_9TREE|nr:hypothetical protein BCR39DRAFT_512413 [Naematelia encephala]